MDQRTEQVSSHIAEFDAHFQSPTWFPGLKGDWCEPTEQLHSGGWEQTRALGEFIESSFPQADPILALDLCCGEGFSANYLASAPTGRSWQITGVDVNADAIQVAKRQARENNLVEFRHLSAFHLNEAHGVPANHFHVVYGQEPDVLASPQRAIVLNHVFRMLRPQEGMFVFHHHWIPGFGWSQQDLQRAWARDGRPGISADSYVHDLKQTGFDILVQESIASVAKSHLTRCYQNNLARVKMEGESARSAWLQGKMDDINRGLKYGLRVVARKP